MGGNYESFDLVELYMYNHEIRNNYDRKVFIGLNFNDCKFFSSLFYTVECAKCHKNRNIVNYGPNFENPKICI